MNTIVDFIKNFHPSTLELGLWDILTIIGLTIAGLVLINWLISFLPARIRDLTKKTIAHIVRAVSYGLMVLLVLNAILMEDYGIVLGLGLLIIGSKIDSWYKLYDDFVDKRINNNVK